MSKHPENPYKNYEDYLARSPFQTIKLLLPFLPAANQKTMIILIKFMELKYTMEYFQKGNQISFNASLQEDASPLEKFSAIIDFLPPKEQESVEQILSMMSVMEAFQTMTGEEDDENDDEDDSEEYFTTENFTTEESSEENSWDLTESSCPSDISQTETASDQDALSDITICSNIEF